MWWIQYAIVYGYFTKAILQCFHIVTACNARMYRFCLVCVCLSVCAAYTYPLPLPTHTSPRQQAVRSSLELILVGWGTGRAHGS